MIAAPLADIPDRGRIRRDSEIAPTISNCWCAVRTLRLTSPIEDGGRGSLSQSLSTRLILRVQDLIAAPLADIPDRGRIRRDSEIAPTISNCWCAVRTLRLTPPIEDGGRGSLSQSLIASLIPSYNKGWCARDLLSRSLSTRLIAPYNVSVG